MAVSKAVAIQRLKEKVLELDDVDLQAFLLWATAVQEVKKDMATRPQQAAPKPAAKENPST